jgi:2-desacetyl-2-hydroxyethyl bacteriochlorophyllide A dehydrogenase
VLALVFESPMQAVVQNREIPTPGPGEALVKIAYSSFCGSDLSLFRGVWHGFSYPVVPGHEWSGEVVAAGSPDVEEWVGRRVVGDLTCGCGRCSACAGGEQVLCEDLQELGFTRDGSCADYMTIPVRNLFTLPEHMPMRAASQVEPLAVALHALSAIDLRAGEKVAILGAGGIGLTLMQAAKATGAEVTVVSEPVAERREFAAALGATAVSDAGGGALTKLMDARPELVPDVVLEASGYPVAVQEALEVVRPGGRVCLIGYRVGQTAELAPSVATIKALTIRGVLGPGGRFADAIDMIAGGLPIGPLLTHEFPLQDAKKALEIALERSDGNVRSVFRMS